MIRDTNMLQKYSRKLDDMNERDQKETLLFASVLADPLNRRIMAKLTSKHIPISVNSVPTDVLQATKPEVISRLCRLERYGLVTSQKKMDKNAFYKVYSINDNGKKWVHNYMKDELNKFQTT